jgi:hypothetical protein
MNKSDVTQLLIYHSAFMHGNMHKSQRLDGISKRCLQHKAVEVILKLFLRWHYNLNFWQKQFSVIDMQCIHTAKSWFDVCKDVQLRGHMQKLKLRVEIATVCIFKTVQNIVWLHCQEAVIVKNYISIINAMYMPWNYDLKLCKCESNEGVSVETVARDIQNIWHNSE